MNTIRILFKVTIALAVGAGLWILIQHSLHAQAANFFPNHPYDPQLVLKQSKIVGWDHGQKLWEFSGDELVVDHQGKFLTYHGNGLGKAYYENKPFLAIRAPQLRFDMQSKNLEASKGVVLSAKPSTVLTTQDLIWNQQDQQLFIPGKVFVKSPYGRFNGDHLTMFSFEGKVIIKGIRMDFNATTLPELRNGQGFGPPLSFPSK